MKVSCCQLHLETCGHLSIEMLRAFSVCDVQINIKLNPDLGNGGLVWPSTFFLADQLRNSATSLRGLSLAELGAGTGLLGIWAATQGAHVVLTDLNELVPLLNDNVLLNMDQISKGGGTIRVEAMLWGEKSEIPAAVMDCSMIVGSGCLHAFADLSNSTDNTFFRSGPLDCVHSL
jgi:hypothetical protein